MSEKIQWDVGVCALGQPGAAIVCIARSVGREAVALFHSGKFTFLWIRIEERAGLGRFLRTGRPPLAYLPLTRVRSCALHILQRNLEIIAGAFPGSEEWASAG